MSMMDGKEKNIDWLTNMRQLSKFGLLRLRVGPVEPSKGFALALQAVYHYFLAWYPSIDYCNIL
jgi:hypothetical protein